MSKPKDSKDRVLKTKATLEAKAQAYKSQKIQVNPEWSIVRVDDLNWQIKQKGRKEPWDRWYFGTLRGALTGVFDKALNEEPQKFVLGGNNLVDLAERIQACLEMLEA